MRISSPEQEAFMQSDRLRWFPAGAEANVAVGLANLGNRADMVSAVPDNPLGDTLISALRGHGVDTRHILRREGRLGLYFHSRGAGARPGTITYDRQHSVFATLPQDAVDFEQSLSGTDWLHISGVTPAVSQSSAELACRIAETAADQGIPVSFDFNYRASLWAVWGGDPQPYLARLVGSATLLFANDFDLALAAGESGENATRQLRRAEDAFERYPRLERIITATRKVRSTDQNSLTAMGVTRSTHARLGPVKLRSIVDRIGSGDAFAAAAIHAQLRELPLEAQLDLALNASVHQHSIIGDFPQASLNDLEAMQLKKPRDIVR